MNLREWGAGRRNFQKPWALTGPGAVRKVPEGSGTVPVMCGWGRGTPQKKTGWVWLVQQVGESLPGRHKQLVPLQVHTLTDDQ